MTRRLLSVAMPPKTPARTVLLVLQRGHTLHMYAAQGLTRVPLPESLPASLPILAASEKAPDNVPVPPLTGYEVRLCLSAENVLFRAWHFPFSGSGKVRQALRFALNSELPFPDTALEHALLLQKSPADKRHTLAVSASIKTSLLQDIYAALARSGLQPELVTFDPFPALEDTTDTASSLDVFLRADHAIILQRQKGVVAGIQVVGAGWQELCPPEGEARVRFVALAQQHGPAQAFAELKIQPDSGLCRALYDTLREDARPMPDTPAELSLNVSADVPLAPFGGSWPISSLSGDPVEALLRLRRPLLSLPTAGHRTAFSVHWKTVAVLYALTVGAALFALWGETRFQERRAAHLEHTATGVFRSALPELANRTFGSVQMESILRQRISATRDADTGQAGMSVVALLDAIHQATPETLDVRVNTLRVSLTHAAPPICGLSCTAPDYETVSRFKEALEALPQVTEVLVRNAVQHTPVNVGATRQRGVQFDMELHLNRDTP